MSNDAFNRAQANWDNMLPPEDPPEVPEYLIIEICQKWAEDPPDWMRERAEEYWQEEREKNLADKHRGYNG